MVRQSPKIPEPRQPLEPDKARSRPPNGGDPFKKPDRPSGIWQMLAWVIFEYPLLERYAQTLTRRQWIPLFCRAYLVIAFLASVLYLAGIGLTVGLDLPVRFPEAYQPKLHEAFASHRDSTTRARIVIEVTTSLALGLAMALAMGLAGGLAWGRRGGLAVSLALSMALAMGLGLALGLSWGLAGGLAHDLAWGLAWGLALGLGFGLAIGLAVGLAGSLAVGVAGGIAAILAGDSAWGLAVIAGSTAGLLRLPFYPWHVFGSAFGADFYRNAYLNDVGIWLPLPGMRARLTTLAEEDPVTARSFIAFLLEYRPLQRRLAMHLAHAAAAGEWRQHVLDPDHLRPPEVVAEEPRLRPSATWIAALKALAAELRSSELQSHIGLKKEAFERFARRFDGIREQTLREPYRWHRYYLGAIDLWREEAQKKLAAIEREAQRLEPISPNVYRPGEALSPETDRDVFVGREDLRERLAREILTARRMPMLLIQGQRRVGKTSLLNFLQELLGSRFLVVYQDLQSASASSVQKWMQDLRARVAERLGQAGDSWQAPEDWLDGWNDLEKFLKGIAVPRDQKLILALDEYEKLHELLLQNSAQGARLLGAMRSFSQHQDQVAFMFVGSALFSELHDPDWANYFVQAVRFPVDYLPKEDAVRLITAPVRLRYAPEVIDRLYELTQGHPALLQLVCRKLVDIANRVGRGNLSLPDLDRALAEAIERETLVFTVFWNEFCRQWNCRETVERILSGEPLADKRALLQLQEHGYIVDKAGEWRMRVPLFETWLRRYKDAFA